MVSLVTTVLMVSQAMPSYAVGVSGVITLRPSVVPQVASYREPFDQSFCDAYASQHHTTPVKPCMLLVRVGVGAPSSSPPAGSRQPLRGESQSASPDAFPWTYVTTYIETCDQPSGDTGPECSSWSDTVDISYQYDGDTVGEDSVTAEPPSFFGGWGVTNGWSGCSPSVAYNGGYIGCGNDFTACFIGGLCGNDGQRLYIDTSGNISAQCWASSGGCVVVAQ